MTPEGGATRHVTAARRAPRAVARATALGAVLAASSVVAGAASASAPQAVDVQLAYTCQILPGSQLPGSGLPGGSPLPAGTPTSPAASPPATAQPSPGATPSTGPQVPRTPQPATVRISASFPAGGTVGQPIQPSGVRLTASLPPAVTALLAKLRITTVNATSQLTVVAAQGTRRATLAWPSLAAPATRVPASGGMTLAFAGAVPPVTAQSPGTVGLTAAGWQVALAGHPSGANQAPGRAPQGLFLVCATAPGQQATLAAVPVTAAAGAPAARHRAAAGHKPFCPPIPKKGLKLNKKFPLPKPPKGAKVTHPQTTNGCAYIIGYSNVRKLKGAALVGPGLTGLTLNVRVVFKLKKPEYFEFDSAGELDFKPCPTCKIKHALPPAHTTFLGFGFMPVSATLQLTEVGTTNIISVGGGFSLTSNTVWTEVRLQVSNVKINGVPVDVGPHCQSATPVLLKLLGDPNGNPPYSLQNGGPLTGNVTLPNFTGCGAGDNLDPLFTASISGPKNFVLLTQGPLCPLVGSGICPPRIPKPIR